MKENKSTCLCYFKTWKSRKKSQKRRLSVVSDVIELPENEK